MSRKKGSGRKKVRKKVPGEVQPDLKDDNEFRVPSIVMIPVGLAVGYFVAHWAGAIFGGIIGIFLWRSRA